MADKRSKPSPRIAGGLETAPPAYERPYLRDPFLYLTVAAIAFWAVVLWLFWG